MMKNIYRIISFSVLIPALLWSCTNKMYTPSSAGHSGLELSGAGVDNDFLSQLSTAGIFDAAKKIGLDASAYLTPLARKTDHPYRRYRWSVGYHNNGGVMINALPPEEEMGWTPWERWFKDDKGVTRRESWVLYPLKNPTSAGTARWYRLEENDLAPRYLKKPSTLEEQLRQARIYEAATVLGFDANEMLIKPLSEKGRKYYEQCRWVVVPHFLGVDDPVIYILPPMDRSDEWPWESWYSDGKTSLIHHPHYTKQKPETKNKWKEYAGAPQRPPEIFGVEWYWHNDMALKPTMFDLR